MIRYEDQCVGCPTEMGCLGSACPYMGVPVLICDRCRDEVEDLYDYYGEQLCEDCLLKEFDKVNPYEREYPEDYE